MKKIWLWIVLGVVGLYALSKVVASKSASAQAAAGAGLAPNPLTTLWNESNTFSKSASGAAVSTAQSVLSSLAGGLKNLFGASQSQGPNSPSTAGSGTSSPTQPQINAASGLTLLENTLFGSRAPNNFGS